MSNECMTLLAQYKRDERASVQAIRKMQATMESYRQEITTVGMSSPIAEALESAYPGSITRRARLNAFTRYPSPVNEAVGLEALDFISAAGVRRLVQGLLAAAVAALALLIGHLVRVFRGQQADRRRARAADPRIFRVDPSRVGRSHPEWVEDLAYQRSVTNFKSTISVLLTTLASGGFDEFLSSVYRTRPAGVLMMLSMEIENGVKLFKETLDTVSRLSATGDMEGIDAAVLAMRDEFQTRQRLTATTPLPGGRKGTELYLAVEEYLGDIDRMFSTEAITKPLLDGEIYEYGMLVTQAEKKLETVDHVKLTATLNALHDSMQAQRNRVGVVTKDISRVADEALSDAVMAVQHYVTMQTDLMQVLVAFSDAVRVADEAFCDLLREQLAAMSRAGVDFQSDTDDRHFHVIVTNYLNK